MAKIYDHNELTMYGRLELVLDTAGEKKVFIFSHISHTTYLEYTYEYV